MRKFKKKPMTKYLAVYGMWQKPDLVPWHISNLRRRTSHKQVDVMFIFDTDDPVGVANYKRLRGGDDRRWDYTVSTEQIYEIGIHLKAIDLMMEDKYESLIVFQDDHGLLHADIVGDIEKIRKIYGNKLGVIGGRDGYTRGLNDIYASHWSKTLNVRHWMAPGSHAAVDLLNTGPWIYHRSVIDAVGKPDPEYGHFNTWEEYTLRCREANLQNVILGTNILHEAWGSITASTIYTDNKQNMKCLNKMLNRWKEHDDKVKEQNG